MLAATVLAGPGSEAIIRDALLSAAPLVDRFLVLNSGGPEVARAVNEQLCGWVAAASVVEYAWPGDYAQARNDALAAARTAGADWALTLDTDERLELDPAVDYRAVLKRQDFDVFTLLDRDNCYHKPRFIRLTPEARWFGRVHEVLEGLRTPWAMVNGAFWELKRDAENDAARFARGEAWCREAIAIGAPHRSRWVRHLGECLLGTDRYEEATEQWKELQRIAETPDERSWAIYRLCEMDIVARAFHVALQRASLELGQNPGYFQEFAWIMAYAHVSLGANRMAVMWAEHALHSTLDLNRSGHHSLTWQKGCEDLITRIMQAVAPG